MGLMKHLMAPPRAGRWDTNQQRFELAVGEMPSGVGKSLKFAYVSDEAMVVTADDAAAIAEIGFRLAKRYEDDTIDNVSLARTLSAARLDRHNQLFEEFIAISLPGEITRLRPGVAPVWEFQRQQLGGVRLLVEQVSERDGQGWPWAPSCRAYDRWDGAGLSGWRRG